MNKKSVIILLIICISPPFIFFGYFFLQGLLDDRTSKEIYLDTYRSDYYSFKIDTIYRDKSNHNVLTIESNKTKKGGFMTVPPEWEYNHFQVGDSIVKYKDSLQIYIYRNQKLDTILDYNDIWIRP